MKLTKDDKAILLACGYLRQDLPQIEEAMNRATYMVYFTDDRGKNKEEYIIATEAREILGNQDFLYGLGRAAFHWTTSRPNADQSKYVSIDCRAMFRENG